MLSCNLNRNTSVLLLTPPPICWLRASSHPDRCSVTVRCKRCVCSCRKNTKGKKKKKKQVSGVLNSSLQISFRDKPFLIFRIPSLSCLLPSTESAKLISTSLSWRNRKGRRMVSNWTEEQKEKKVQGYPQICQEVMASCRKHCGNVIHEIQGKLQLSQKRKSQLWEFL